MSLTFFSCKKFLDEKVLKEQFLPSTIEDLQAILRSGIYNSDPALLELLSDNYYVTTAYWQGLTADVSSNYIWAPNAIPFNNSWNTPYRSSIYYSNIVLDQLLTLKLPVDDEYNEVKGTALFYRANSFFNLAQVFAKPYNKSTLSDLGIVLRTTSDINVKSTRASIRETYDKIVADLTEAINLLPNITNVPTMPNKNAVYASLARIYLIMGDYENAFKYADLVLKYHNTLIDFNDLVAGVPIKTFNAEVIFHSQASSVAILTATNAKIDPNLFAIYRPEDLRRSIFFRPNTGANVGTYAFRGSFAGTQGTALIFTGTTTAEMLLIRAECYARKGDKEKSVSDVNTLLAKRISKNNWLPINPSTVNDPLTLVLSERRKELPFRGLRWMDLRRLNMEGANITLKRVVNNIEYTLPPNDNRWVALIPYDVINRSGIEQNPR